MRDQSFAMLAAALLLAGCGAPADDEANGVANSPSAPGTSVAAEGAPSKDRFLYPGSRSASAPDRFVTTEPIDRVVAWYRDDAARRAEMMFVSTERLDDGHLVIGTAGEEGKSFALKLTPRSGGTESRVLPYDPKAGLDRSLLK